MNQAHVYTYAKWQVKEGELDNVLQLLAELSRESSREKGNLFYKVHQSHTDPHTLILWEGYADNAAVEIHRSSPHFQSLVIGKIIPKLEHREVLLTSQVEFD